MTLEELFQTPDLAYDVISWESVSPNDYRTTKLRYYSTIAGYEVDVIVEYMYPATHSKWGAIKQVTFSNIRAI